MRFFSILALTAALSSCNTAQPNLGFPAAPASNWQPMQLTANQRASVERQIRNQLKDPESARFGGIAAVKDDKGAITVCGAVNAKNSFGGYTGHRPFVGLLFGDSFLVSNFGETDRDAVVVTTVCAGRNLTAIR